MLINKDNLLVNLDQKFDLIFADFIYENSDFSWANKFWNNLKEGGIFIGMTDFHTVFEFGVHMKTLSNSKFVNHLAWKNEWGNHPKNKFHQCFDDILIFSKNNYTTFHSERIQIPKATANTKLNPSGRETKTATAFIDDVCLTTTSKERIKKEDGSLIRWQKPQRLYDRIILPFTEENDSILDLFMGSGSLGLWCKNNNRNYVGIELDPEVYEIAKGVINGS